MFVPRDGYVMEGWGYLLSLCCMSQFPLLQNLDNEDTTSRVVVRISGVMFVKCAVDVSQCLGYCHSSCGHPLSTLVEPALVQGPEGSSSHFPFVLSLPLSLLHCWWSWAHHRTVSL